MTQKPRENLEPQENSDDAQVREDQEKRRRAHDDNDGLVEEWGEESFPASDPPSNY